MGFDVDRAKDEPGGILEPVECDRAARPAAHEDAGVVVEIEGGDNVELGGVDSGQERELIVGETLRK